MLTVASINVNGIRAAHRRGMPAWLADRRPDVLCLQEVRAPDAVLCETLGDGWALAHSEPTIDGHAGRAGVAVASRSPITAVREQVGGSQFDGAGRWVEADLHLSDAGTGSDVLTVVSVYVHTGEAGTARQEVKYAFLDAVVARMQALRADGRHVLVCGDLNVAHREADLKNWQGNLKKSGFLLPERAVLDRLLGELGWVDVVRAVAGDGPGPYSWWSWRGKAFDNDSGWRIDYQLATPELGARVVKAGVDRAATYAERWSDHAPVVASYDV